MNTTEEDEGGGSSGRLDIFDESNYTNLPNTVTGQEDVREHLLGSPQLKHAVKGTEKTLGTQRCSCPPRGLQPLVGVQATGRCKNFISREGKSHLVRASFASKPCWRVSASPNLLDVAHLPCIEA